MKKYNYKYFIGFVLGVLLFGGSVYASIIYSSNIVHYDSTSSSLISTNVQAAIDELASRPDFNLTSCSSEAACYPIKTTLALGDYVLYTPSNTSYTIDNAMTGYTYSQGAINPSELNLWRVISLNQDGTVDIISENISSKLVFFSSKTGYINFVGYLNTIASQYETSGITVGSRHFGYNRQTEIITDTSKFTSPAPWKCDTGTSGCNTVESQGGGDILYTNDYNLVNTVLGTTIANLKNGRTEQYWMASRFYNYDYDNVDLGHYSWNGRYISYDGSSNYYVLYMRHSSFGYNENAAYIRPIVTLKSGLSYSGVGNEEYPMEIVGQ